jgi:hypothetical protein
VTLAHGFEPLLYLACSEVPEQDFLRIATSCDGCPAIRRHGDTRDRRGMLGKGQEDAAVRDSVHAGVKRR